MTSGGPGPAERPDDDALRFALHCADALAGSLHVGRTVQRLLDLAVPRFGDWAEIALDVGDRIVVTRVVSGASPVRQELRGRRITADLRARLAAGCATATAGEVAAELGVAGVDLCSESLAGPAVDAAVLTVGGRPLPRPRTELAELAARGARALTAAQAYEERADLAATLRSAVVPPPLPDVAGLELGASYRTAQQAAQVGGDFYEVAPAGDGGWAVTVGDVCGKGVEAAVLTGQVRQSLRTAVRVTADPADALRLINDTLLASGGENFVTVLHGRVDVRDGSARVRLACGGHPAPLVLTPDGVRAVDVHGTLVGMLDDARFGVAEFDLHPGEVLLAFTDGALEARGRGGLLGLPRIVEEFADCSELTAQTVADRLMQLVLEHLDGRRHDDIAFVAVRVPSNPARAS